VKWDETKDSHPIVHIPLRVEFTAEEKEILDQGSAWGIVTLRWVR